MVAIVQKNLTFEEFLNWDDGSGRSFELVNGVAMPLSEPTAKHEDVVEAVLQKYQQDRRASGKAATYRATPKIS
jgi:Uma2 family endonuclease